VTVGPDGTAYVADVENHRVSLFGATGGFVRAMGESVRPGGGDTCTAATGCQAGAADGTSQALGPAATALGPEGRLFVADGAHDRIVVYDADGTFNYFFSASRLHGPLGIEFDPTGFLYVANSTDNRIDVFTPGGAFIRGIGKDVGPGGADVCTPETGCFAGPPVDRSAGSMYMPEDVAIGPEGQLIVADTGNNRIDVFAPDGSFLRAFGKEVNAGVGEDDVCTTECQLGASGAEPGAFESPVGVVVNAAGRIYVADRFNARISVSDFGGGFLAAFGVASEPFGLTLDCRGALHVSEIGPGFARVERFGEPGMPAASCVPPSAGEPIQASLPPLPSNRIRFAGLVKNRRNGSAVLFVRVPGPGRLILKGRGVRRLARGAPRAMRVRLPVKPKVRLRHFLKKHGKGRIRVEVTFRPLGGIPKTLEKPILLKRKRR
jgi:hypothetical protein